jgi:CheY-like chemotaxis protein
MEAEIRDKIFEPFYTTKGNKGTGLGLSTVYGIIRQHNGNIQVESELGRGTIFQIYLPLAGGKEKESQQTPSPDKYKNKISTGSETILLAEDDEIVRRLTETILKQNGYRLMVANNGDEALRLLEEKQELSLLLTDVIMPGMNGKELYHKILQKYTGLKVLFMSGYPDDVIAEHGVLDHDLEFIQKPFTQNQLLTRIREVLDKT